MSVAESVASLKDVGVRYESSTGPVDALVGVSLAFAPASATAVVGRSGSGKSTLVSVLSLLRRQTTGQVCFSGRDTESLSDVELARLRAAEVGIVFQSFHLEPTLSALENVALPWVFCRGGGRRRLAISRAAELLEALGIADLTGRRPTEMSGGQRQRVAIARALFGGPRLFIADEPTGNLDEDTANAVTDLLFRLPDQFGTAVVVVTHDHAVAARADRRLTLARGRLVAGAT